MTTLISGDIGCLERLPDMRTEECPKCHCQTLSRLEWEATIRGALTFYYEESCLECGYQDEDCWR